METISISLLIGLISGIVAYATFFSNNKKNTKQETKEETTAITSIGTKLDLISKNVDEIRLDNKDFSKTMHQLGERVSKVEQSTTLAHHRIDSLEELHRK